MLVELLIQVAVQIVLELLAELGFTSVREAVGRNRREHPTWAALGIALVGGAAGALTVWVIPHRVLPRPPVPGLSLILGPVAAGGMMHLLGRVQAANGRSGSRLATFWGGALFAFSFSVARLLLLAE
ncbi:MAG TPA: hypothetical protein VFR15_16115 [Chloroflexia bacterium]|nr:hypothetical protein [Chloroflexia bacterium]